jgi:hypothetical protein
MTSSKDVDPNGQPYPKGVVVVEPVLPSWEVEVELPQLPTVEFPFKMESTVASAIVLVISLGYWIVRRLRVKDKT